MKSGMNLITASLTLFVLMAATASLLRAERVLYYSFEEGHGTVIHNDGANGTPGNFIGGNREGSWGLGQPGYGKAIELQGGDVRSSLGGSSCGEFRVCSVFTGLPADVRFVDTEVSLSNLNVDGDATYMAWVRWDGHLVEPLFAELFAVRSRGSPSKRYDPNVSHAFRLMMWSPDNDKMSFHAHDKDHAQVISQVDSEPQDGDWIGKWTHVAYQLREEEIQVFVNGDPIFDEPEAFRRTEHSGTLQVGFWAWGTFNGAIDEVKIFDEALTQEKIIAEMAPPEAANPSLEVVRVLDLGQVPFSRATTGRIRVSNTGASEPLVLESAAFTDTEAFKVESFPDRLESGEVSEILVRVTPAEGAGQRHGTLEIRSNDARGSLTRIAVMVSVDNRSELVTHLSFDGKGDSRRLNNLAPSGDPAAADGEILFEQPGLTPATGQSARFSGGVVKVSDPIGEEMTLALWVQPEVLNSEIQTICGAGHVARPAWALTLIDGRLAWFGGGNTTEVPDYLAETRIVNPEAAAPFHLAASIHRMSSKVKVVQWMVDGLPQEAGLELPGAGVSVGNLLFVGAFGEGVLPFQGALDDVQVYERLLASEEMALLYANPGETLATLGEPDSDGDGLLDVDEAEEFTDPLNPDTDADGLDDGEETRLGSNPLERDSDGGGTWDDVEARDGTDPLAAADDLPIWTIHAAALSSPAAFEDMTDRSLTGLDVFREFTFQRREIDFQEGGSVPQQGIFAGGEDLDDVGLTLGLQQIFFITGRIVVERGGVYTLGVARENAFRLLVDGEIRAEITEPRSGTHPIALSLSPGIHEIELQWLRGRYLELFHWEEPGDFSVEPPLELAVLLHTAHVDDVDIDEDGLPDFWELTYVSHLGHGSDDDPDGDGLSM